MDKGDTSIITPQVLTLYQLPQSLEPIFSERVSYHFFSFDNFELPALKERSFSIKIFKRCPSHLALLMIPSGEKKPIFFLKLYTARPFKRNRVKAFYKNIQKLEALKIPYLTPFALWWASPWEALLKRVPFYGGILFPYLESGFICREKIFLSNSHPNLSLIEEIIHFLYTLHEKGVLLRDSKIHNYYLSTKGELKLFDLDGIKFYERPLDPKDRLKDLHPLVRSLTRLGIKDAKKIVFRFYANLYPSLPDKTY